MTLRSIALEFQPIADAAAPETDPGRTRRASNRFPSWSGNALQGWLLAWIRSADPELAAQLHSGTGRKPYTISSAPNASALYQVRVTTLSAALSMQLDKLLNETTPPDLFLSGLALRVIGKRAIQSSYEALIREATEHPPYLGLRFVSPTTFHSNRLDLPLPLPSLVYGSLIHAWDRFSPLPLPLHLHDLIHGDMMIARHQLRSERITAAHHGSHVGFTGRVQFGIRPQPTTLTSEDYSTAVRLIGALTRYAYFAGVGVRTAAGMGAALLLDDWNLDH